MISEDSGYDHVCSGRTWQRRPPALVSAGREVCRAEVELPEEADLELGRPGALTHEGLTIVVAELQTKRESLDTRVGLEARGSQDLVDERHALFTGNGDPAAPLASERPDHRE